MRRGGGVGALEHRHEELARRRHGDLGVMRGVDHHQQQRNVGVVGGRHEVDDGAVAVGAHRRNVAIQRHPRLRSHARSTKGRPASRSINQPTNKQTNKPTTRQRSAKQSMSQQREPNNDSREQRGPSQATTAAAAAVATTRYVPKRRMIRGPWALGGQRRATSARSVQERRLICFEASKRPPPKEPAKDIQRRAVQAGKQASKRAR